MKIILHICCGVCASGVVERLSSEGHRVVGFFYNPNIYPPLEYNRRLEATYKAAKELNFPLEVAPYTPDEWFEVVTGLENEGEGGKRCEVCFRLRLTKAYVYMEECGADAFTTTLTVSPHKSAAVINRVGQEVGRAQFLVMDFKKKDGFKRAIEQAKKLNLYRQDYCGCLYSMTKRRQ